MTQIATDGLTPAAAPASELTPAPQPAPVTPTPQPAQTAPQQEDFIRVPKQQLQEYNGDFHEAMRLAKQYRQAEQAGLTELGQFLTENNYSPAQYLAYMRQLAAEQQTPQDPAEQPSGEPGDEPLTLRKLEQALEQREQQSRQQQTFQQAQQAELTFRNQTLDAAGFKPGQDGKYDARGKVAINAFNASLMDAIEENLPPYLPEEQRKQAINAPASPAVLAQAAEKFNALMADWTNEAVANAAKRQTHIPGSTLAGGQGRNASEPSKPISEMNAAERYQHLTGLVKGGE